MDRAFAKIAFSDASRLLQEKYGSRRNYARLEQQEYVGGLTANEVGFIETLDGFFLSTISPSGFPYVQFRGGPKGFLKVIDQRTLGIADFRGNMQYITTGNLETNSKAALFLIDYASKTRLKLYATVSVYEKDTRPDLIEQLMPQGYSAKAERAMLFHIEGYDWNCPQHITPRYTEEEIQEALVPFLDRIKALEAELEALKSTPEKDRGQEAGSNNNDSWVNEECGDFMWEEALSKLDDHQISPALASTETHADKNKAVS